ncbi:MAG: metallophosphoesterase [Saprospiraceae bacterium]|nr:metallophosphoesterase [Saprospiraceae bacterium]
MYKTILIIPLILLSTWVSSAQNSTDCDTRPSIQIDVPEGAAPWSSLDLNNDPCLFQFAIVTDRTGGLRPGIFKEGIGRLNLLQPEFVMSVGDFIPGYTTDQKELDRQWNEFEEMVTELEMPFFYVPGNHDLTNEVMLETWKERFGPTYYHFTYKDVLFLCLNSEDQLRGAGRGTISDEQHDYVAKVLAENPSVKWTLVFLHQPLWSQNDPKRWPDVEKLLAGRNHSVFAGHVHRYTKWDRNDGKYFTLATTGGGSRLRGAALGEFDHVSWVSMTENGPILANIELEGIWNEDVVTSDVRTYISKVQDLRKVLFSPHFATGEFSEGSMSVKITNDADVPMKVKLSTDFSWDLVAHFEEPVIEVGPNSVASTQLHLTARRPKDVTLMRAVPINVHLALQQEDGPDLAVPFQYQVKPLAAYHLAGAQQKIMIDGDLEEWDSWNYEVTGSGKDASAVFDLSVDDEYLYVAARVTDDQIVRMPATPAYNQDAIAVVVGMDPAEVSAMSTGQGWYREELFLIINPEKDGLKSAPFSQRGVPEGVKVSCKASGIGYDLEMAIPVALIKEKQGEDWQSIRFNLGLLDFDPDEQNEQHYFQPDWRGKGNVIGSGLFFKK